MVQPFINIFRTINEAFSFRSTPDTRNYILSGVQLLPNNPTKYVQLTNTPNGITLNDWVVLAINIRTDVGVDISNSFSVEKIYHSINGDPQFYWKLENILFDFGDDFIYLKITQSNGEIFYTNFFKITNNDADRVSQLHYKVRKTDKFQSIGLTIYESDIDRVEELVKYTESGTGHVVTAQSRLSRLNVFTTEKMPKTLASLLMDALVSPFLYVNKIRASLYEAVPLPARIAKENHCSFNFKLSFSNNDLFIGDYVPPVVVTLPDYDPRDYNPIDYNTGVTPVTPPPIVIVRRFDSRFDSRFA